MEYEVQISAATNESYALKVQVKVTSSTQERGRVFSPNRGRDTVDVPLPLQLCKTWMHALSHSILIHKTQNGKHFNPEYVSAGLTSPFPIMVDSTLRNHYSLLSARDTLFAPLAVLL